jgi:hypothetical protein
MFEGLDTYMQGGNTCRARHVVTFGRRERKRKRKRKRKKNLCHDEVGQFAHNIDTILGSFVDTVARVLLRDWLKRKDIFFVTSYNFCI